MTGPSLARARRDRSAALPGLVSPPAVATLVADRRPLLHAPCMTDWAEHDGIEPPDVSHLVTEDDAPVESLFHEKQMRLLVEPLYSSWRPAAQS